MEQNGIDRLTPREQQIVEHLVRSEGEKRTAYLLNISVNTVHSHIRRIYRKLDVHSQTELVCLVLRHAAWNGQPPAEKGNRRFAGRSVYA
jgi:DNA-binding CsgD family transcriptional regulator